MPYGSNLTDTETTVSKSNNSHKPEQNRTNIIYRSDVMRDLLYKVRLIARTDATILITGENGTGKEALVQFYHSCSSRRNRPMVSVNCGAIPSELVESELFGHEKGAFTGAVNQKKGCFEMAHRGVLFLDEIGEMPISAQVKLLRAVELGSFRRVGGREEIQVDVTLVSATNKILSDQIQSGTFREDLFYRLNVIELYLPPLRHRKEDISLLIDHFIELFSAKYGVEPIEFDTTCMEIFMKYDWPGNIRQLKNVVERSVVLSEGRAITPEMLPGSFHSVQPARQAPKPATATEPNEKENNYLKIPIGTTLDSIERQVIEQTLRSVDNNKTEAARLLGFARKTLHNKLERYESD